MTVLTTSTDPLPSQGKCKEVRLTEFKKILNNAYDV